MVDYSKWDALELSDDSDIEVHPNVDKRSFIRAKQNQIHLERQQRKLQIEGLKYERVINAALEERLSTLLSKLRLNNDRIASTDVSNVIFRTIMELAPRDEKSDEPPPRPERVYEKDQALPTYTKMLMGILDQVHKDLRDEQHDPEESFKAILDQLQIHLDKIRSCQKDLQENLAALEKLETTKITSDSYHTGFDSSHVNKDNSGTTSKKGTTLELLNPDYSAASATTGADALDLLDDNAQEMSTSSVAKEFARIKMNDFHASQQFISAHPEILREAETDGLLVEAFNTVFEGNDVEQARQFVHQALILQWCRLLGPDGVALFFKRISSPGHQARALFEKEVSEKVEHIKQAVKKHAKRRQEGVEGGVEQIQIYAVDKDTEIRIRIPPADSADDEGKKARSIFETFQPDMKAALETGSLEEVNKVLAKMDVADAETLVGLLGDSGCLSLEKAIIDATTEEGKSQLKDLEHSHESEI